MNEAQQKQWKFVVINHVLIALSRNENIRNCLIFKGAIILNHLIETTRVSLDLDSNLDVEFTYRFPKRKDQKKFLHEKIQQALTNYFENQNPVRYEINQLGIEVNQKIAHPMGRNAFKINITLIDHENSDVRGLPRLRIDIAAPESFSPISLIDLPISDNTIKAYSLERIAGEKARAFLSSLPTYRNKMSKPVRAVRVKDLYDLSRIIKEKPINEIEFWQNAGEEFQLACKSRFVDCKGIESFMENWEVTKDTFEKETIIPSDISFDDVENDLLSIINYWEQINILPFSFSFHKIDAKNGAYF